MRCAGILLTGGASHRFGVDKSLAVIGDETLAARSGRVLATVCDVTIEVGPGHSGLPAVDDRRDGPLVALGSGWDAVVESEPGGAGPAPAAALVLACDLPLVTASLLRWLADFPGSGTAVPLAGSPARPQPLCARWDARALAGIPDLVAQGARSMRALLESVEVTLIPEVGWMAAAGQLGRDVLADADTPEELLRLARLAGVALGHP